MKMKVSRLLLPTLLVVGVMVIAFGCAPKTAQTAAQITPSEESNEEQQAPIAITWTPDSDCAVCHTSQQESMSDSATFASLHASETCLDCHTDVQKLEKLHSDVTTASLTPSLLKRTQVSREACLPCHSQEELVVKTADNVTLTDQQGTTVNPHDLAANDKHATLNCGNCHKIHDPSTELEENARSTCRLCHHADVYECYTCH
jgi:hypothetical protein